MENTAPRILVLSHTSFTKADSMGSTLASYFSAYPPENIAQFFIKDMIPDIPVCKNYYRVTDKELLKKLINPFGKVGSVIKLGKEHPDGKAAVNSQMGEYKYREWGMLVRKYLWKMRFWNTKEFKRWVDDFAPQMIMVQPGDFSTLLDIGVELAKKRDIPLVVHQSEAYYLKDYDKKTPVYRFFRNDFKRSYEKMMEITECCIYLCDALKRDYDKIFSVPSYKLMKSASIEPKQNEKPFDRENVRFIYGGNLGNTVGRAEPLLEMGRAVKKLGFNIDVYTADTLENRAEMTAENGILLHNAIPYGELQEEIKKSDFILHMESRREWNVKDLKYAFSTKIADMLASGVCSIVYGPTEIASIRYFKENDLGCVIERAEDLEQSIRRLIDDDKLRKGYIERALNQARTAHCKEVISERMRTILCEAFEEYKKKG